MSTRTEAIALKKDLTTTNKELKETKITLESPMTNANYSKMKEKNPVKSLVIPNKLFLLWKRRRTVEGKLGQKLSEYAEMVNESLHGTTLNASVATLRKKLETENCRFQSRYKKMGGALRTKLTSKHTNILLLEGEISSTGRSESTSTSNTETITTTTSALSLKGDSDTADDEVGVSTSARVPPISTNTSTSTSISQFTCNASSSRSHTRAVEATISDHPETPVCRTSIQEMETSCTASSSVISSRTTSVITGYSAPISTIHIPSVSKEPSRVASRLPLRGT